MTTKPTDAELFARALQRLRTLVSGPAPTVNRALAYAQLCGQLGHAAGVPVDQVVKAVAEAITDLPREGRSYLPQLLGRTALEAYRAEQMARDDDPRDATSLAPRADDVATPDNLAP